MTTNKLSDAIEEMQKDRLPERDLWQGIELAIQVADDSKNNGIRPLYALAASIVLAITVGFFSFYSGQQVQTQQIAEQMTEDYAQHREALLAKYKDVPAAANYATQMKDLEDAAEAIKKALEDDQTNPVLLQMLKRVYEQQISLIESVHAPDWQQI